MRTALLAAAVAVASTLSIPAHAEDGATKDVGSLARRRVYFGELLAASTAGLYSSLFAYGHSDRTEGGLESHRDTFSMAPRADVRVAGMLTLGGTIGASYGRTVTQYQDANSVGEWGIANWAFSAVPRVGLLVPIGERFAFFPRVGAGFVVGNQDTSKSGSIQLLPSAVKSGLLVTADASLLLALMRQIYLSLGPTFTYSSVSFVPDGRAAGFGVGATVALGISL